MDFIVGDDLKHRRCQPWQKKHKQLKRLKSKWYQKQNNRKTKKKYTDADVDAIIDKKFAKWKSEQEAEKSEAKKMAKMNEKEKADYEKQKLLDELQELKTIRHAMS